MFDIKEELKSLPSKPGVYMMFDKNNIVIYVGKAISLKNRVRQYFQSEKNQHPKVKAMVKHIEYFEYIIVDTEVEALILESNLIKKYKPKYNILLRDDKQYPYIKINYGEKFPRVMKTRRVMKDKSKYFGPYPNVFAVNDVIDIIRDRFKIRTCNQKLDKNGRVDRPCLNYHINKCFGPCEGIDDNSSYMLEIEKIDRLLSGKDESLLKNIKSEMYSASSKLDFEKAGELRDKLKSLEIILEKQKISINENLDQDIIGMAKGINEYCIQIFFVRNGKILGREHFIIDNKFEADKKEVLSSFIKQFYIGSSYIAHEILVEESFQDIEVVEKWLSDKKGRNVKILIPQRGDKLKLISMVKANAVNMLKRHSEKILSEKDDNLKALNELKDLLKLKNLPKRIESYDISNIQGTDSVGSMVVFEEGRMKKSDYRRFKINSVEGPDDYKSMQEILSRRFIRGIEEREYLRKHMGELKGFSLFPDLILMDGGKGQVNIANLVLDSLGLDIEVAGLVKDEDHQTRGIIYKNKEYLMSENSQGFKLIYKIQEEVHRFAINYHRSLRSKKLYKSELDDIEGVGPKRKRELFKKFKTIDKIKSASLEELNDTETINKKVAEEIYNHFRKDR